MEEKKNEQVADNKVDMKEVMSEVFSDFKEDLREELSADNSSDKNNDKNNDNEATSALSGEKEEFHEKKRWLFLGLPFTFTTYHIKEDMITVDTGLFTKEENDCYMYKVRDVRLVETLFARIVKVGTIICYTGDTTDHKLVISHVKNAKEIKNFILKHSEEQRAKRRVLNTMELSHGGFCPDGDLGD